MLAEAVEGPDDEHVELPFARGLEHRVVSGAHLGRRAGLGEALDDLAPALGELLDLGHLVVGGLLVGRDAHVGGDALGRHDRVLTQNYHRATF